jgi:hypothetical protein
MFIPQKPYMLLGSLREQLCYPQDPEAFSDDQLRHGLAEVLLPDLVTRYPDLDIRQDWPRLLTWASSNVSPLPACCFVRPASWCWMRPPAPSMGRRSRCCMTNCCAGAWA